MSGIGNDGLHAVFWCRFPFSSIVKEPGHVGRKAGTGPSHDGSRTKFPNHKGREIRPNRHPSRMLEPPVPTHYNGFILRLSFCETAHDIRDAFAINRRPESHPTSLHAVAPHAARRKTNAGIRKNDRQGG